jgi:hypothetical protein
MADMIYIERFCESARYRAMTFQYSAPRGRLRPEASGLTSHTPWNAEGQSARYRTMTFRYSAPDLVFSPSRQASARGQRPHIPHALEPRGPERQVSYDDISVFSP